MLQVRAVTKRFESLVAVDAVSFTAEDGRVTGLLGPNGAGKTTTLRLLCGLVRPDSGELSVGGHDLKRFPDRARALLGALPDARGLYPRLTARENIRYFGELQSLSGNDLERRIDRLIERLDLTSHADRRVAGFSQGERAKVAIARALVHDPPHVLLDEPTNGLDVMSTRTMRDVIRDLRRAGKCVVFSSHLMPEVAALCDKVVVMAGGKVVAEGAPEELVASVDAVSLEEAFVRLTGALHAAPTRSEAAS